MRIPPVACSFALALLLPGATQAQEVISAASGVVQYFEGAASLDGQQLQHDSAIFPTLKRGATLRTAKGRAEVLLTPGVFLRLDENSAVRMLSPSLADTRLELVEGSVILENLDAKPDASDTLIFKECQIRFPKPGIYRIDGELGDMQAYRGEAVVEHHGSTDTVDSSHLYYFAIGLTTSKFSDGDMDEFYDWARNRSDVIAAKNQLADAQNDPGDPDPGGMYVIPPPSLPSYSSPDPGYSISGSFANPFYVYPPAGYFTQPMMSTFIVFYPYRRWPAGSKWPASGGITSYPHPGTGRWPATSGITTYRPGLTTTPLRYPVHYPAAHAPAAAGSYHPAAPVVRGGSVAPSHAAVHVGGVHR